MTKNIFLTIEVDSSAIHESGDGEWTAQVFAEDLIDQWPLVTSVQYRYGAFGRVEKVHKLPDKLVREKETHSKPDILDKLLTIAEAAPNTSIEDALYLARANEYEEGEIGKYAERD